MIPTIHPGPSYEAYPLRFIWDIQSWHNKQIKSENISIGMSSDVWNISRPLTSFYTGELPTCLIIKMNITRNPGHDISHKRTNNHPIGDAFIRNSYHIPSAMSHSNTILKRNPSPFHQHHNYPHFDRLVTYKLNLGQEWHTFPAAHVSACHCIWV